MDKKQEDIKIIKRSKREEVANKIIYIVLQAITLITAIISIVNYFVVHKTIETTVNQVLMCALTILTFNIPIIIERKFKLYIPPYITIILFLFLFGHFILGEIYRFYDSSVLFDKILHTMSGVVFSFISFSIISILNSFPRNKINLSPFFIVLFTFCFTMTTEYLWELYEYAVDTWFGFNMQRWKTGYIGMTENGHYIVDTIRGNAISDTMGDMIVNIWGCLGVCIYAYIGMKVKPNWFKGKIILTEEQLKEAKIESKEAEEIIEQEKMDKMNEKNEKVSESENKEQLTQDAESKQ